VATGLALPALPRNRLRHNFLMRFPDRPDIDPSSDGHRREGQEAAPGLAERLLRLARGHPSGVDAVAAPAEGDQEEAVSHLPWPDDWVVHESGDPVADADDTAVNAEAGGQPESGRSEGGERGAGWPVAGNSPDAAAGSGESRDPYRPWFTAGDAVEPWFAGDPDWPGSDPGG
jgi:hypothetical protein